MLGLGADGRLKKVDLSDPLTGKREIKDLNKATPAQNMAVFSEAQLMRNERAQKMAEAVHLSKKQKEVKRKEAEIRRLEKANEDYQYKALQYQRKIQQAERLRKSKDMLSVERAAIQFAKRPFDRVNFMDSGFKSPVAPLGRAAPSPSTDFERVISATPFGYDTVNMPGNPLSGVESERITEKQMGEAMGFLNLSSLSDAAKSSLQTEAEKRLQQEIANALNPAPKSGASTTQVVTSQGQPQVITVDSGIDMKKALLIGGGILGVGLLSLLVIKMVRK